MNSSTQSDDHYTATQLTRTNIGSDESAVSGSNLLAMELASDEPSGQYYNCVNSCPHLYGM